MALHVTQMHATQGHWKSDYNNCAITVHQRQKTNGVDRVYRCSLVYRHGETLFAGASESWPSCPFRFASLHAGGEARVTPPALPSPDASSANDTLGARYPAAMTLRAHVTRRRRRL
ncbi:hypothetical protein MRX96_006892 [Rhipicephalus microplus]